MSHFRINKIQWNTASFVYLIQFTDGNKILIRCLTGLSPDRITNNKVGQKRGWGMKLNLFKLVGIAHFTAPWETCQFSHVWRWRKEIKSESKKLSTCSMHRETISDKEKVPHLVSQNALCGADLLQVMMEILSKQNQDQSKVHEHHWIRFNSKQTAPLGATTSLKAMNYAILV